ncbi:unnamed protein product [Lactuca saligna]|uniref:Uncharacterized protein n=1 Tax=Lactuca saligna TaxID=75948 RepID=A0AA35ZTG5_LACSI|nr:unnamed protein product [Lactuca saligna]
MPWWKMLNNLENKVEETAREKGGLLMNEWLVGQHATHVVCEASLVGKYLGQSNNLVTVSFTTDVPQPLWFLKKVKEMRSQRLVHLSADLACHLGMTMHNILGGNCRKDCDTIHDSRDIIKASRKENQSIAMIAKMRVKNRRTQDQVGSFTLPTRLSPFLYGF